jgi:hypothetical protein
MKRYSVLPILVCGLSIQVSAFQLSDKETSDLAMMDAVSEYRFIGSNLATQSISWGESMCNGEQALNAARHVTDTAIAT